MPLSEHEQQLLDQIERALYAEDPKFASTVRGGRLRRPTRRRRIEGIALFVVGIGLLITGLLIPLRVFDVPVVSVVGFLLMFGGALLTFASFRHGGGTGSDGTKPSPAAGGRAAKRRSPFAQKMEDRLRKRFEQG